MGSASVRQSVVRAVCKMHIDPSSRCRIAVVDLEMIVMGLLVNTRQELVDVIGNHVKGNAICSLVLRGRSVSFAPVLLA